MLNIPKGQIYHCQTSKDGHGFKQKCLNPNFLHYKDGRIVCALCGTVYANIEALEKANSVEDAQQMKLIKES